MTTFERRMKNGLTEEEAYVIGTSIKEGFTSGTIGKTIWSIEYENHDWKCKGEEVLKIHDLIMEGKNMGYYPSWKLNVVLVDL